MGILMGNPALEAIGICHAYGSRTVLASVSLKVEAGCLTCLTGESGCGKTTLLKIIAGLEKPRRGIIKIEGHDASLIPTNKRNIGFVFQSELALFYHLNVRQNVAFPFTHGRRPVPNGDVDTAVNEILDQTDLQRYQTDKIANLSGGLKQRVAIARALVYRPAILLLDEPLSSLDNPLKTHLFDLLRTLKNTGDHTFLYVTHDDLEIVELADRVAILHGGSIIREGSLSDVLANPAEEIVRQILRTNRVNYLARQGGQ
jgi:ABC-type Fe3+/spermidine/putrescine transport system ATPase subunit